MGWGVLQIFIAWVYLVLICRAGWRVNEEARKIVVAACFVKPGSDEDRMQLIKFQHLQITQLRWGIGVLRAFLLERSFLFTLMSTIMAYAFVLMRFSEGKPSDELMLMRSNLSHV